MYKNILVAVDGSDNNKPAVRTAVNMAVESGAKLTAVYVENVGYRMAPNVAMVNDPLVNAESVFEFIKAESQARCVKVEYKVVIGHPGESIADMTSDYDLVICGSLGRSGLKKAVLGSVSEMITRFAECPVLIVRK
ncbi:MAG: universal stress protein [Candidatus Methanomethylophilaceae archaeon]|nr:universal stress protein [Candidatus Methanomethylophilaceae archaeon]